MTARDGVAILLGRDAHVIDVSDPHHPIKVGQFQPFQLAVDVELRSGIAYLAVSTFLDDAFSAYGGFELFDISEPTRPVGRGSVTISDDVLAVALGHEHAYLAADDLGMRVILTSDSHSLQEVASDEPLFSSADSVVTMRNHVFVGSWGSVFAFDPDDASRGEPLGCTQRSGIDHPTLSA